MDLNSYLRTEGKHAPSAILYRRLSLLQHPWFDDSGEPPSLEVVRGLPPVPPSIDTSEAIGCVLNGRRIPAPAPSNSSRFRRAERPFENASLGRSAVSPSSLRSSRRNGAERPWGGGVGFKYGCPSVGSQKSAGPTEMGQTGVASGFEELHRAIEDTVDSIVAGASTVDVGGWFIRLAAHVRMYTSRGDDEKIARYVNGVIRSLSEQYAGNTAAAQGAYARTALWILDSLVSGVLHNTHPGLREALKWCRDAIARALYCPPTNLHPEDLGCAPSEMRSGAAEYQPVPEMAGDELGGGGEAPTLRVLLREKLRRYGGAMAFEDNAVVQEKLQCTHEMLRQEKEYAERLLAAERMVCRFWQNEVKCFVLRAWRNSISLKKEYRKMATEKRERERELARMRRVAADLQKEKAKQEASFSDQLSKAVTRSSQVADACREVEEALRAEKEKCKELHKVTLQRKAEFLILSERLSKAAKETEQARRARSTVETALQQLRNELQNENEKCATLEELAALCETVTKRLSIRPIVTDLMKGGAQGAKPTSEDSGGVLQAWMSTFAGGLWPKDQFPLKFIASLHRVLPEVVTEKDVEAAACTGSEAEQSSILFDLLQKPTFLGSAIPFFQHTFTSPVQPGTAVSLLSIIASHLITPAPPAPPKAAAPGARKTFTKGEVQHLVVALASATDALATACGGMTSLLKDARRWPEGPPCVGAAPPPLGVDWAPDRAALAEFLPAKALAAAAAVPKIRGRVREYSQALDAVKERYSTIFIVRENVSELLTDCGASKAASQAVFSMLPAAEQEEVSPPLLSAALIKGGVTVHPQLPVEAAFEAFMQDTVLKATRVKKAASDIALVVKQYQGRLLKLYQNMGNGGVRFASLCKLLTERGLLHPDDTDPAVHLNQASAKLLFELALQSSPTDRRFMRDSPLSFPQLITMLLLVAQMVFPSPILLAETKLRKLLDEYVFNKNIP
ncbi:hypothetical protein DIPPA_03697 [Diplonema papillatum]|nr:hypothetical protein DIPPA_03697 [Diplonema papillatum]